MTHTLPERTTAAVGLPGPRVTDDRSRKHVQVREFVRSLAEGLVAGAPMPSERELVARFGVARMTVRQALDALVAEGLLDRVPGRGTFVAERREAAGGLRSFTEEMRHRQMAADSRTLHAQAGPASAGVARALGITATDQVWHWRRLRLADARPMAVEDAWFAVAALPDFDPARPPTSLFDALAARGLRPVASEDSVAADLASPAEAQQLGISRAAPVLRVARRCLAAGRPVVAARSLYRADRYTHWSRSPAEW
ncbi:GntR family transcriptional regulator [Nocardioides lentus]